MSIWAALALIPGISHLLLGGYVLTRGYRKELNLTFALLALSLSIWSFSEFGHRIASTPEVASYWIKFGGFGWAFMASFCTHFVLVLTKHRRVLRKKLTYVILYVPSLIILLLFLGTDLIYQQKPVRMYYGYTVEPGKYVWLYSIYYIALYVYVIFLLVQVMRRGTSLEKKQAAPILYASTVFLILTTGTNVVLPLL